MLNICQCCYIDNGADIWDHGLSEFASDMESMDSITSEFVEAN